MIAGLWYGVKVQLKQTEYYKPSIVTEHNTADITDIVQVRDISGSNIEVMYLNQFLNKVRPVKWHIQLL